MLSFFGNKFHKNCGKQSIRMHSEWSNKICETTAWFSMFGGTLQNLERILSYIIIYCLNNFHRNRFSNIYLSFDQSLKFGSTLKLVATVASVPKLEGKTS